MEIELLQPNGLVVTPAFSHVAVIPPTAVTAYLGGQNGVDETSAIVSEDVVAGLLVPGELIELSTMATVHPSAS